MVFPYLYGGADRGSARVFRRDADKCNRRFDGAGAV